eukprot:CAMPEP_0179879242 /NCGR_PEP_ID=MMETSP0982-20121206/26108_1 /TAXON_ID=483367 /ORGANISM="non described non described, Strain CCMP 2436" /LENGTH=126 /DNA_ID=CAMNT_0021772673 /DNA_START=270 /DNA_END=652 /DNA_ORIENTATION=-
MSLVFRVQGERDITKEPKNQKITWTVSSGLGATVDAASFAYLKSEESAGADDVVGSGAGSPMSSEEARSPTRCRGVGRSQQPPPPAAPGRAAEGSRGTPGTPFAACGTKPASTRGWGAEPSSESDP